MATGIFAEDGPDLEWGGLTPHLAALLQVRNGLPTSEFRTWAICFQCAC